MKDIRHHDVRKKRYGCTGLWVFYICHTCNSTFDSRGHSSKDRGEAEKAFLIAHTCKEIKDETDYKGGVDDDL